MASWSDASSAIAAEEEVDDDGRVLTETRALDETCPISLVTVHV